MIPCFSSRSRCLLRNQAKRDETEIQATFAWTVFFTGTVCQNGGTCNPSGGCCCEWGWTGPTCGIRNPAQPLVAGCTTSSPELNHIVASRQCTGRYNCVRDSETGQRSKQCIAPFIVSTSESSHVRIVSMFSGYHGTQSVTIPHFVNRVLAASPSARTSQDVNARMPAGAYLETQMTMITHVDSAILQPDCAAAWRGFMVRQWQHYLCDVKVYFLFVRVLDTDIVVGFTGTQCELDAPADPSPQASFCTGPGARTQPNVYRTVGNLYECTGSWSCVGGQVRCSPLFDGVPSSGPQV